MLICVGDLSRSGQIPHVADGTKWSKTIQNAIVDNIKLKPHEAVINENFFMIPRLAERKRPAQSIIKHVQHCHTHMSDGYEFTDIVLINKILKPFLNETSKAKQKRFFKWALDCFNNHNNIFICSDESWHEVKGLLHEKECISVLKGQGGYKHAVFGKSAKFSLIQLRAKSIKR